MSLPVPIAHWPLSEGKGTNVLDVAGGNTGTIVNFSTSMWVQGRFGNALQFNGTNEWVDGTNNNILQLYTGTVSAWIKTPNAGTSYAGIVVKQFAYGMFLYNNIFGIYDWTTGNFRSTGINLSDNNWHQVAFTFQSGVSNGTVLYIDGQPVLTTTLTISSQNVDVVIGAGFPGIGQVFNGIIADVRIYNTALTASQVQQLYQQTLNQLTFQTGVVPVYNTVAQFQSDYGATDVYVSGAPALNPVTVQGLVGYWPLDEGAGTTVYDYSGNNNTGTFVNSSGLFWAKGVYGSSVQFSGSHPYISIPSSPSFSQLPITVSFWQYGTYDAVNLEHPLISKNSEWLVTSNEGASSTNYTIWLKYSNGSSWDTYLEPYYTLNYNQWYHIVAQFLSTGMALYVNGVLVSSYLNQSIAQQSTSNPILVANLGGGYQSFSGFMDDIRVYNRALTSGEISTLYSATVVGHVTINPAISDITNTAVQTSLISYHKFDEGVTDTRPGVAGNIAFDASGNNNNGVIHNATFVSGYLGTALQFNPSNATYVDVATNNYSTTAVSVSAWINPYSYTKSDNFVLLSTDAFEVGYNTAMQPIVNVVSGTTNKTTTATSALTANTWQNAVYTITVSNSTVGINFYKNNTAIGSATFSWGISQFNFSMLRVGATSGLYSGTTTNEYLAATVDELKVFNGAITTSQISAIYSSTKTYVGTNTYSSTFLTLPLGTTYTTMPTSSPANEQYIISHVATTYSGFNNTYISPAISGANETLLITPSTPYTIGLSIIDQNSNPVNAISIQQNQTFSFSITVYPVSIQTFPDNVTLSLSLPASAYGITGGISTTNVNSGFTVNSPATVYMSITTNANSPFATSTVQVIATDAINPAIQAIADVSVDVVQNPNTQQTQGDAIYDSIIPFTEVGNNASIYTIGTSNSIWAELWATKIYATKNGVNAGVVVGGAEPGVGTTNQAMIDFGFKQARQSEAGKMGYQVYSSDLDIVGAGTATGQRNVKVWDNLDLQGKVKSVNNITTAGNFGVETVLITQYNLNVYSYTASPRPLYSYTPPITGPYHVMVSGHTTLHTSSILYMNYVSALTGTTNSMSFYFNQLTIDAPIIDVTIYTENVSAVAFSFISPAQAYVDSLIINAL